MKDRYFRYVIERESGEIQEYFVEYINNKDITIVLPTEGFEWAKSENVGCSNCPLKDNEYCNFALSIHHFIEFFKDFNSYEAVSVTVYSNDLTITKLTTIQQTALSILNLIVPFSECPKFSIFREVSLNHYPFESFENVLVRALGYYYLNYINHSNHNDISMYDRFLMIFSDMREPIRNVCNVLRKTENKDATLNALILLDTYILLMTDIIEKYKHHPVI